MESLRAELLLYRGRCHADGLSEGRFGSDGSQTYPPERHLRAVQIIERCLCTAYRDSAICVSGIEGVADSEKEAIEVIHSIQQRVKYVRPMVTPLVCRHGKIVFDRKVTFEGWPSNTKRGAALMLRKVVSGKGDTIPDEMWEQSLSFSTGDHMNLR